VPSAIIDAPGRAGSAFASALHTAIGASGLTLEQVRCQLEDAGVKVSLATLSYWRHGRSQPERASSLRAVRLLEQVLGLPTGALTTLLEPARSRRERERDQSGQPIPNALPEVRWLADVFAEVEAPAPDHVTRLALRDTYQIGPDRAATGLTTHLVLRANVAAVSRFVLVYGTDLGVEGQPRIRAVRYARLGRQRWDERVGLLVMELLLERQLAVGDTALLECDLELAAHGPAHHFERHFTSVVRQYLLEVRFDQRAVPVRSFRYTGQMDQPPMEKPPEPGMPDLEQTELFIGSTSGVHAVGHDVGPNSCGMIGIHWLWS
jgi:hypothetical protein